MTKIIVPFYLLFLLGGGVGWARNIIAVTQSDFASINGEIVVRVIGIAVVPLGAVIGWVL